ncbi:hypothetical protein PTTG_25163 [Puccinia triticina 1-1 BBBD Race 1]|uniref:Protein kinase domain-containing protein n=1 Tax=Puccinia triticina (isolate 1-1 / race 1 (BBBD)) TaxID=630390 RepID=A0A180H6B1_PUCT1|nr:hypothetical protein PTTG_25163 [Puccinia triticina 1-1 BBBD Race 1]
MPRRGAVTPKSIVVAIDNIKKNIRAECNNPVRSPYGAKTSCPLVASHLKTTRQLDYTIPVKLCEFGNNPSTREDPSWMVQSPGFRTPEVNIKAAWDHQIDIWSFGSLMFVLLTGINVFHTPEPYNRAEHLNWFVEWLGHCPFHMITAEKCISMMIFEMDIIKKMEGMEDWCLCKMMAFKGFKTELINHSCSLALSLRPILTHPIPTCSAHSQGFRYNPQRALLETNSSRSTSRPSSPHSHSPSPSTNPQALLTSPRQPTHTHLRALSNQKNLQIQGNDLHWDPNYQFPVVATSASSSSRWGGTRAGLQTSSSSGGSQRDRCGMLADQAHMHITKSELWEFSLLV